jgi:lipopolysaccharide/colanic/teichoic acid biosynthesis glycosyltransferase
MGASDRLGRPGRVQGARAAGATQLGRRGARWGGGRQLGSFSIWPGRWGIVVPRMRILMITQWFDPEPTFKGQLFASELARRGHAVEVVTGFPNYPGGKLYEGYRMALMKRERIDGVDVLRVPLYPSHDASRFRRVANYLSFMVSATVGVLLVKRPDVAYVYHPPATVALPALALLALKGVPFVYDVQDLWPDTLASTGMLNQPALLRVVGRWSRYVYGHAAHVVVLSEGFRKKLIERGVVEGKITTIPNWAAEDQLRVTTALEEPSTDRFDVMFAGNMGRAQALDIVLDAAAALAIAEPKVRLVMVGSGTEVDRLKAAAYGRGLSNVEFLARRPVSEMGRLLARADALLVHLKDDPLFSITIPSKTQAYLLAGRPILMGVRGDAADLVEAARAGVTFAPEDATSLVQAVQRLVHLPPEQRREMGASGARYYRDRLALAIGAERFESVLERARQAGSRYEPWKRAFDLVVAVGLLAALAVPMLMIAVLCRWMLGAPVLFRQQRPGRFGQPFTIIKFRTMTDRRDPAGVPLPDALRLTRFGRFLRSTSLDELPELINVIKGEMSLVGPRPLLLRYVPFFTDEEMRRLNVRPGVTGWAQVNGRNTVSWDERLAMDVWYTQNMSWSLDVRILWMTVSRALLRRGVVADPESIMENLDVERRRRRPA